VLLSIAVVPLPYAVTIGTACVIVFDLARRIQHRKAAFNAANFAVAVWLAGTVAHAVSPAGLTGVSVRTLAALALASVVFVAVNSGGVAVAVALAQQVPSSRSYRHGPHHAARPRGTATRRWPCS
jgi:hypothetical protein